jgi:hypothetical protein
MDEMRQKERQGNQQGSISVRFCEDDGTREGLTGFFRSYRLAEEAADAWEA